MLAALSGACEDAGQMEVGQATALALDSTFAAHGVCASADECLSRRVVVTHGGLNRREHVDVQGVTDPALIAEAERCARRVLAARPGREVVLSFYRGAAGGDRIYRVRIPEA